MAASSSSTSLVACVNCNDDRKREIDDLKQHSTTKHKMHKSFCAYCNNAFMDANSMEQHENLECLIKPRKKLQKKGKKEKRKVEKLQKKVK